MKQDPLWNEIESRMQLEEPSATFTAQVMRRLEAGASSPSVPSQHTRSRFHAELANALFATAATFLFVATGLWSALISVQGGSFSLAVQEMVGHTIALAANWF
ncbi:hypothetical protein [Paenibacillus koleovorans]|uniref:hypothetical protein n=1 Tax=Paenibacillus koleovorans TaxID=121608 RepID=UPI000FD765B9|nr:hypothetical protein [Paenibacillus koleovorans]